MYSRQWLDRKLVIKHRHGPSFCTNKGRLLLWSDKNEDRKSAGTGNCGFAFDDYSLAEVERCILSATSSNGITMFVYFECNGLPCIYTTVVKRISKSKTSLEAIYLTSLSVIFDLIARQ